jgi:hypothetical protein
MHVIPAATAGGPARGSAFPRVVAALVMGLVLLALSALIHAAAAASLGGGWMSLGAMWLVAVIATLLAVQRARSGAVAWRRMCLVNAVASLVLLVAGAAALAGPGGTPDRLWPNGPVLGVAVASAVLTIAGLLLALLFFGLWHLLSRRDAGAARPA